MSSSIRLIWNLRRPWWSSNRLSKLCAKINYCTFAHGACPFKPTLYVNNFTFFCGTFRDWPVSIFLWWRARRFRYRVSLKPMFLHSPPLIVHLHRGSYHGHDGEMVKTLQARRPQNISRNCNWRESVYVVRGFMGVGRQKTRRLQSISLWSGKRLTLPTELELWIRRRRLSPTAAPLRRVNALLTKESRLIKSIAVACKNCMLRSAEHFIDNGGWDDFIWSIRWVSQIFVAVVCGEPWTWVSSSPNRARSVGLSIWPKLEGVHWFRCSLSDLSRLTGQTDRSNSLLEFPPNVIASSIQQRCGLAG